MNNLPQALVSLCLVVSACALFIVLCAIIVFLLRNDCLIKSKLTLEVPGSKTISFEFPGTVTRLFISARSAAIDYSGCIAIGEEKRENISLCVKRRIGGRGGLISRLYTRTLLNPTESRVMLEISLKPLRPLPSGICHKATLFLRGWGKGTP
jgi:hypothetical protein